MKNKKLIPLNDQLIVDCTKEEQESLFKIHKEAKSAEGKIVSVGDKVTKLKEGDLVVFKPTAGYELSHDNKDLVVLQEEDVIVIFEEIN